MLDTVLASVDSGRREILAVAGSHLSAARAAIERDAVLSRRETRRHGLAERVSPTPARSGKAAEPPRR